MRQLAYILMFVMEVLIVFLALNGILHDVGKLGPDPVFGLFPDVIRPLTTTSARFYWAAALLLPVAHLCLLWQLSRDRRSITLKSDKNQSLMLYHSALVKYVRSALNDIPDILRHDARVKQVGSSGLALTIFLELRHSVENIPKLQEQVERTIRRQLTEVLGLEKLHLIKVIVRNFGEFEGKSPRPAQHFPIQARETPEPGEPAKESISIRPRGDEVQFDHARVESIAPVGADDREAQGEIKLTSSRPGPERVDLDISADDIGIGASDAVESAPDRDRPL